MNKEFTEDKGLNHLISEKCQMRFKLKLKILIVDKSMSGHVISSKINS